MMGRKSGVLITGANGEIGHGLIEELARRDEHRIAAVDLRPMDDEIAAHCAACIVGDILDDGLLQRLVSEFEIHTIYHLAALLSTRSEYVPENAHQVNVNGTLNLLKLAHDQSRWHGQRVCVLFPSSIAVYGLPSLEAKRDPRFVRIREFDWNHPTTMYGCNKLYCEQLGRYYTHHYRQLAADRAPSGVDFRAIRFPGLVSAKTLPAGGTSDFAPEMIHAAARGEPYACFVREDTQIPFMAMPDAIKSLLQLSAVDADALSQRVYNVGSFSPTAAEFRNKVRAAYPQARITFDADPRRSAIVDTWPADVDDSAARDDWGWAPDYDFDRTFDEYLIPTIRQRYADL